MKNLIRCPFCDEWLKTRGPSTAWEPHVDECPVALKVRENPHKSITEAIREVNEA